MTSLRRNVDLAVMALALGALSLAYAAGAFALGLALHPPGRHGWSHAEMVALGLYPLGWVALGWGAAEVHTCWARRRAARRLRGHALPALLLAVALPATPGTGQAEDVGRAPEGAVLEAVFRQQIREHLDATERARGTVVCIAVDPGGAAQSPSREFMARLAGEASLRRAAECDPRPTGAIEATTLRPAIVVTAGPIDWVAEDEAWVTVSYYRSARWSARRRYRVVREREGWLSLGPILVDGPL